MNTYALKVWSRSVLISWLLLAASVAEVFAADTSPSNRKPAPARGHYAKLAQLDPEPAKPDLPIDAERWKTDPKFIERVEKIEPQYVKVPLDTFVLPPCPANSSRQTRAELDYLLRLQANRTETEGERALYFAPWGYSSSMKPDNPAFASQQRNLFYVGRSIGSWFNPTDLPITAETLGRVWRDASHYMWRLKFKSARIRPYNIDPKIKPLLPAEWAAFPSGHSFYSHMLAYIYSELAPEFSDIFLNDARAIAHSREIIGVHFPSDSEAGRVFARQFVDLLLASAEFQPEFEKIRKEWTEKRAAAAD
ncbi:MAG TPA: phosphatase PAP2 family protein [Chthoniobacterales bacterium]|nr:phosphatase PAP2 family protein [Chthoniobacterales bacterium]